MQRRERKDSLNILNLLLRFKSYPPPCVSGGALGQTFGWLAVGGIGIFQPGAPEGVGG